MYYQQVELPRDNMVCRAMPLCITQQVQTGRKCIQKRGIKSACQSAQKTHLLYNLDSSVSCTARQASNNRMRLGPRFTSIIITVDYNAR